MKRKYAEYYYSIKKTEHGYMWQLYSEYRKGAEVLQSSTDADDFEDRYFETKTGARSDVIEAIQDHYS